MTTPFDTTPRQRLTAKRRLEIFTAAGGRCHICEGKIDGVREKWEIEHIISLENGGSNGDDNLAPAHVGCHRTKTRDDRASAAKGRRIYAKHNGLYRPRSVMPGSRASKWKRKIDGTTVRRDE